MSVFDQTKPPLNPPPGEDDDVIELTEVLEEPPAEVGDEATAEVVLDFRPGSEGLASLKATGGAREEEPGPPSKTRREESLDDFLASLPDLPEDLDIATEAMPPPGQPPPDLRRELAQRLSDAELRDLVRQVVQETVDRLARELFPEMASEAIDRELALWKKRLTQSD